LNYGSAGALAAASRALRGYRDALADECLAAARRAWDMEQGRQPNLFRHGNTTGGDPQSEKVGAAVELLITTREPRFAKALEELWPVIDESFGGNASDVVRALPFMSADFARQLRQRAAAFREQPAPPPFDNPFGVPIPRGGWAGNGWVIFSAMTAYDLHVAFPDLFPARNVFLAVEYVHGRHPGSDISFVSGVGAESKRVAYGANRADFSFIAGGIVPGVLIVNPDLPENKEDWPFLWGENEYVISLGAAYVFLMHAANALVASATVSDSATMTPEMTPK
jgi:hypothetical protein